jgi:hypothetical protein
MASARAGGLLIATVASMIVCVGCRGRGSGLPPGASAPAASAGSVAAARPPLTTADRAAYARGREREVALMRTALARLQHADGDSASRRAVVLALAAEGVEREGAAAAGLAPERYRALVARMDSLLRSRGRGAVSPGAGGSADEWRLLDSLRVELAVLRSRFAATAGDPGGATP